MLQEAKAAEEQRRGQVEAELKTLKENAVLDFERIGLLSEENAALQVGPYHKMSSCGILFHEYVLPARQDVVKIIPWCIINSLFVLS